LAPARSPQDGPGLYVNDDAPGRDGDKKPRSLEHMIE
jgi:hypothetical protein